MACTHAFQLFLGFLLIVGVAAASFKNYEVKNVKSIRSNCAKSSTLPEWTYGTIKDRRKRDAESLGAIPFARSYSARVFPVAAKTLESRPRAHSMGPSLFRMQNDIVPRTSKSITRQSSMSGTSVSTSSVQNTFTKPSTLDRAMTGLGVAGLLLSIGPQIAGVVAQFQLLTEMRQQGKIQEAQFEEQMKFLTIDMCLAICVTNWEPWAPCSAPCGGGMTYRTRNYTQIPSPSNSSDSNMCEDKPCPHALREEAICNEACAYGGVSTGNGSCMCTRGYHGQCCNNEHICDYPGKPMRGHLTGVIPAQFGGVISYHCSDGFALVGNDTRMCGENGNWQGSQPECRKISCSKPGEPKFGRILGEKDKYEYEFGEDIIYSCNNSYNLVGPERRKCTNLNGGSEGIWTLFAPDCIPVNCYNPGHPFNGHSNGTNFFLGEVVTFSCQEGFRLLGSESRKCQENGKWSGHEPECELITCGPPFIPRHGRLRMTQETYHYGIEIRYMCNEGFQIEGNLTSTCLADKKHPHLGPGGKWSHEPPTCKPTNCGDPGSIENGAKSGSLYHYPNNVTFICFDGYIRQGAAEIHCGYNGKWSALPPTCRACRMNTYKANGDRGNECIPCPENTHTVTNASNSAQQCICKPGWTGQPGGPCTEITCPALTNPPNGRMNCEGNKYKNKCNISCDIGHIMDKGISIRECQNTGTWTGTDASCSACPLNTYQSSQRSCLPCPDNSHTSHVASVKNQCVCNKGYQGPAGGPCEDDDECSRNGGRGPCKDICRNTMGSYVCECSILGYIIDTDVDRHVCKLQDSCRNLTETDAPVNGGFVCHWFYEQNSQLCSVRCNRGYEFPIQTNNYETCGATTNYTWTHDLQNEKIRSCIKEFFPDIRLGSNSSYFVRNCRDLTPDEQQKVKEDFAKMLTDKGICDYRSNKVCYARNVGIICGATRSRRKRGVMENIDEVDVFFDLNAIKMEPSECDKICTLLRIPENECDELCVPTYRRFLRAMMIYMKRSVSSLFSDARKVSFRSVQRMFEYQSESLKTSDVIVECSSGMRRDDDICVPCAPGTFYSETENECAKCPEHTYQADPQQTSCVPCPMGTYAPEAGSAECLSCPENKWGDNCTGTCHCEHGQCDAESGQCSCSSGWEGPQCNIDIQSCTADSCYPGVRCHDIPAPGTGFRCDPCPADFQGDGTICEPQSTSGRIHIRSLSDNHDIVKPASLIGIALDNSLINGD